MHVIQGVVMHCMRIAFDVFCYFGRADYLNPACVTLALRSMRFNCYFGRAGHLNPATIVFRKVASAKPCYLAVCTPMAHWELDMLQVDNLGCKISWN